MRWKLTMLVTLGAMAVITGCSKATTASAATKEKPLTHKYRPEGDQTVHIDMSQIKNDELKKVYEA